ncbi:MAG: DUF1003 domain-containing protein [Firmicutes bacterium]|nr:DUF1003 domain-containing protein [Bacillota bacterium]MCL5039394.1 DUF1003 domain-containing protein [Bacillota bacterium]
MHLPRYEHKHPPIRNVNQLADERMTLGDRVADTVTRFIGSWGFLLIQSALLIAWITMNILAWVRHWDPYPFILLNLILSFQAAYTAPVIMMSQNRQATKDRLMAEHDYQINLKAEEEVKAILEHLDYQSRILERILARLDGEIAGPGEKKDSPAQASADKLRLK